ncbi:hypothetical protein [Rhodococcus qingshengii]|uniref:hypothetical protein n=1 Tax=Rhodococcus qingshengii TaxID=334542 RepID=UPI00071D342C|nr:hypothetical protein [Rhodococcus qingshengii]KSU66868.1 hypothetical protein AS032_31935 [Rhodococcus qingshengii]SCC69681.1 hypothetical protein GA0061093_12936 [Rhodococcus qingshengii]
MNEYNPGDSRLPGNGAIPADTELHARMAALQTRREGLTVAGTNFGIFYDESDPREAELQVTFDDGTALSRVVLALDPAALVELSDQAREVLQAQRAAIEADLPPGYVLAVAGQDAPEPLDAEHQTEEDEDEDNDDTRSKYARASDPMNLRGLVQNLPPIAGVPSSRWLPMVIGLVVIVVVLAALLGGAL